MSDDTNRRPSDAAIAEAFWQYRKSIGSLPLCLVSDEDKAFTLAGNEIVRQAREIDWAAKFIREPEPAPLTSEQEAEEVHKR